MLLMSCIKLQNHLLSLVGDKDQSYLNLRGIFFENLDQGMKEMFRVLKPGGMGLVLEFSKPKTFPMKQLFGLYFKFIMPTIGRLVSKDAAAYSYLPESVAAFPEGPEFMTRMGQAGYQQCQQIKLTGGIASIYTGTKPMHP